MLIVNGGLPRSGTVLVGAILCEILRLQGRGWERYNPHERRELAEFVHRIDTWSGDAALLVHTHIADQTVVQALDRREDTLVLWNHRDPRDVLVSLRKLHDLPLKQALAAVLVYVRVEKLVRQWDRAVRLRYEDFTEDPEALITNVAAHLGAALEADQVRQIARTTSVERHRQIMHRVAAGGADVRSLPTRSRVLHEDPETLINDRHIQSGATGRWQHELDRNEQQIVQDTLRPFIEELGYPL